MIHLDTNFLVGVLIPGSPADKAIRSWVARGESVGMSVVAWGELLCGPLLSQEEKLARQIVTRIDPLLVVDAEKSAELFNLTGRRSRSFQDCMIAAVAIRCGAALATLNADDFKPFVPYGLVLA
jgi:predicted nucleic acid-binding protein